MDKGNKNILAINGGSSSIKFSLYSVGGLHEKNTPSMHADDPPAKGLSGKIERIGQDRPELTFTNNCNNRNGRLPAVAADLPAASAFLIDWLEKQEDAFPLAAVGHRVVFGLQHTQAALIDDGLLAELAGMTAYDPDHLPGELALIRLIRERYPALPQVACFDTAFHASMPSLAKLLPVPWRYSEAGIRRFGFHGLSYAYILEELTRIAGAQTAGGKVIIAHLGNGASMAAINEGISVDTTMGFTPTGGIVMGTRPGDLDPGVLWYILNKERFTPEQFDHFINQECGLLGVSGTSADMQELLARESSDTRAAEAVGLFCYAAKKAIGALTAVLGGLDVLVFTGGIGERSPTIRNRICAGLEYLGIGTRVGVYAIPTDEESMIARTVKQLI